MLDQKQKSEQILGLEIIKISFFLDIKYTYIHVVQFHTESGTVVLSHTERGHLAVKLHFASPTTTKNTVACIYP